MRVVVAGGAGFLGSHLCDALLARGDRVVCLDNLSTGRAANVAHLADRPDFELVVADVTAELPEIGGPIDAVMHLASPASPVDYLAMPLETLRVGSVGTHRLVDLARRRDARFFLASTSEVYGDPDVHPQSESYWGHVNPIGERSVYDEAKRYAEAYTTAVARSQRLDVRIVRIFNTYGPRMQADDGRVVSNFIVQALRHHRRPTTTRVGARRRAPRGAAADDPVLRRRPRRREALIRAVVA
jgi:nucleoside-diphosphate-sugar epimerase